MTCICPPSTNIVCNSQTGTSEFADVISIAQPECVILPDNTLRSNPFYDETISTSYWAYKIVVNCNANLFSAVNIYIPIYENIEEQELVVSERILSCGRFEEVSYNFSNPQGVTPPEGFKYINIPVSGRYTTAACVLYRLSILGDYPQVQQNIFIQERGGGIVEFTADYLVAGEPLIPRITVLKDSQVLIVNNEASIDYTVTITNTGNVDLGEISYLDIINYDGTNITIGSITVNPSSVQIDTSTNGTIRLTDIFPSLNMGQTITITYNVPIVSFATPDTYVFTSSTTATSEQSQGSKVPSTAEIQVVEFTSTANCNVIQPNSASFAFGAISIPNSPTAQLDFENTITIPSNVVVTFTSFGGCTAVFEDTGEPVPINMPITNTEIDVICSATVNSNASVEFVVSFVVVSVNILAQQMAEVVSSLDSVSLVDPSQQVLLGVAPLPNIVRVNIDSTSECSNPC